MNDQEQSEFEKEDLTRILQEWKSPEVSPSLGLRVVSSYRRQCAQPLWRRWLSAWNRPLAVPLPLAAAFLLCFGLSMWLAAKRNSALPPLETLPAQIQTRFVELPVIHEKEVLRVVHREELMRPQPSSTSVQRVETSKPTPEQKSFPADLAAFKPVRELKIEIISGGQE